MYFLIFNHNIYFIINSNIKKNHLSSSLDYKFNTFEALENDDSLIKGSSNKLSSRIKKKLNI